MLHYTTLGQTFVRWNDRQIFSLYTGWAKKRLMTLGHVTSLVCYVTSRSYKKSFNAKLNILKNWKHSGRGPRAAQRRERKPESFKFFEMFNFALKDFLIQLHQNCRWCETADDAFLATLYKWKSWLVDYRFTNCICIHGKDSLSMRNPIITVSSIKKSFNPRFFPGSHDHL